MNKQKGILKWSAGITALALVFVLACDDYEHAPYGDPGIGNSNSSGVNGDADADTDGDSDTDDTDVDGGTCDEDDVQEPGTNWCWRRCPVGQEWSGSVCSGTLTLVNWQNALIRCEAINSAYSTASVEDFMAILGNCDPQIEQGVDGVCDTCSASEVCSAMFDYDTDTYWTSSASQDEYYTETLEWSVSLESGFVSTTFIETDLLAVRCLRSL